VSARLDHRRGQRELVFEPIVGLDVFRVLAPLGDRFLDRDHFLRAHVTSSARRRASSISRRGVFCVFFVKTRRITTRLPVAVGEPPLPAGAGFALQPIDEIDDGVEAAPGAAADAGAGNRYGQMRLAGAASADQHSVALFGEKGAARQIADQRLVDRCAGEVEFVDVFGQRQLGDGQLILDRARLLLGDLGAEQIADDPRRLGSRRRESWRDCK
jgi:hypothetical protein